MTSFKATVRTDTVDGELVRGRKKGKKRERESSQDEPALEKGERQLKSAKIEIILCREEKSRRVGWLGAAAVGSIPALVTFFSFSSLLLLFLSSLSKPKFLLSTQYFFSMKFQPGRSLANRSSAPDSTVAHQHFLFSEEILPSCPSEALPVSAHTVSYLVD